jgi:hypothetical protein
MKELIFGRETGNIIIPKKDISGTHAKITHLGGNDFMVEDLNSTNGTYVNDNRIKKSKISIFDEVRLSGDTIIDLKKVFEINLSQVSSSADSNGKYAPDFFQLKDIYRNFKSEKIEIQKKHNLKVSLLRGLFTILPVAIYLVLKFAYFDNLPNEQQIMYQSMYIVFSALGSTIGVVLTGNMNIYDKLNELDENFRIRYVCPGKCKRFLGDMPWETLANQGSCSSCKKQYVN